MISDLQERGIEMRKKVLGTEYVEQTLASTDKFTQPLQELVNEYCWGAVWARPGLQVRIRTMLTVAMLAALNRPRHLKTHLRAALANGVTREEIAEILMHAGIYSGLPAAVDGFQVAQEVFKECDG